jgi:hypothetical protein
MNFEANVRNVVVSGQSAFITLLRKAAFHSLDEPTAANDDRSCCPFGRNVEGSFRSIRPRGADSVELINDNVSIKFVKCERPLDCWTSARKRLAIATNGHSEPIRPINHFRLDAGLHPCRNSPLFLFAPFPGPRDCLRDFAKLFGAINTGFWVYQFKVGAKRIFRLCRLVAPL